MIKRADKGNPIVIPPIKQYDSKIQDFIQANDFRISATNPTETFQTQIRRTINNSKLLIPQEQ
jgi:hypothetical protein